MSKPRRLIIQRGNSQTASNPTDRLQSPRIGYGDVID